MWWCKHNFQRQHHTHTCIRSGRHVFRCTPNRENMRLCTRKRSRAQRTCLLISFAPSARTQKLKLIWTVRSVRQCCCDPAGIALPESTGCCTLCCRSRRRSQSRQVTANELAARVCWHYSRSIRVHMLTYEIGSGIITLWWRGGGWQHIFIRLCVRMMR